jgi:hypothetical protein
LLEGAGVFPVLLDPFENLTASVFTVVFALESDYSAFFSIFFSADLSESGVATSEFSDSLDI